MKTNRILDQRLSNAQVVELFNRFHAGESIDALAKIFGIVPQYVRHIGTGRARRFATIEARETLKNPRLPISTLRSLPR